MDQGSARAGRTVLHSDPPASSATTLKAFRKTSNLAAGSIVMRFADPEGALQKLMALAMANSQNRQAFDDRVNLPISG